MKLQELSLFYNNLAVMMNAGIGLIQHLETVQRTERNSERRRKLTYIVEQLRLGQAFAATLKRISLLPVFDIPIIESGEKSGKLPFIFEILSKNYELSAQAERNIRSGLVAPFYMFIASLFVPQFPKLFLGQMTLKEYLIMNFSIVGSIVIFVWLLYQIFMKTYYDLELAKTRHSVFLHIPILRGLTQKMALEKFCTSMSLMLEAGLPIFEALKLAGQTSPEHQITLACHRIISEVKSGKSLPQAFQVESIFTDDIKDSISMGSSSGKHPTFLGRSAELLKTQVSTTINNVSKAVPKMIYWSVVIYVGYSIIKMYAGNMAMLNQMLIP